MMNMDNYETGFQLILHAGNAKSKAMMAIEEARKYQFEEAETYLIEAKQDLKLAHNTQTNLIQGEAKGEQVAFSILIVHAQDHLTTAMNVIDQAEEFLHIYRILNKLEGGNK